MDITIHPHALTGSIRAVASKSAAHRLLVLAALAPTTTNLDCNSSSDDIEATVSCLEALGARIARTRVGFRVKPLPCRTGGDQGFPARSGAVLDCGESGSTLRFLLPVGCALGAQMRLTGHGRLASRPLSPLYEELVAHGARLSEKGRLPLEVAGKLRGGSFFIPGDVSSQYASGLLMAAPLLEGPTSIVVGEPIESRPYIDVTLEALRDFGVKVACAREAGAGGNVRRSVFTVPAAAQLASPGTAVVEGDWSNSAFWLAAAAMGGDVAVEGLRMDSPQGDRAVLAALAAFGARVRRGGTSAACAHDHLQGRTIDVSDIPDLVPPLAAVASIAEGSTRIVGAARLRLKESDRLETVCAALAALGADIRVEADGLAVSGRPTLSGGEVDAANDHRIAMMAAIAAAHATGSTTIHGAECVSKSYPRFFEDFTLLGGIAEERED